MQTGNQYIPDVRLIFFILYISTKFQLSYKLVELSHTPEGVKPENFAYFDKYLEFCDTSISFFFFNFINFNTELNDLRKLICLRKKLKFLLKEFSVYKVVENLVENGRHCHAVAPMTSYICYQNNNGV